MRILVYILFVCGISLTSFGERTLTTEEVNTLITTLTQTPKRTWLEGGTIRSRYLEYRAGEETTYESEELFRYDGRRFYWDIRLLTPPTESTDMTSASSVERPDHQSNKHRIFSYDGNTYTRYYKSTDYAVVVTDQQEVPANLFGPFTAGIIPWGLGTFTREKLNASNPSAVEYTDNGQARLRLTFTPQAAGASFEIIVILDPQKQYLPCSYTMKNTSLSIQQRYTDPRQVGQTWIPFIITVERFDLRGEEPVLLSYEDWRLGDVDAALPTEPYRPSFANGTVVELKPNGQTKSFMYHAAEGVDIGGLLAEKIMTSSTQGGMERNCATLAANHIAKRFSKQLPANTAAATATASLQLTSLYDMKQSLEQSGLHCVAVKTDLDSIAKFSNYGVILHYPAVKHYVVLDRIEKDAAWTVDLADRKFYWKRSIRELLADWYEGTALLVSDSPILLSGQVEFLNAAQQQQILGGSTVGYSCTDLIQTEEIINCPQPIGGLCGGVYYRMQERWGCRKDTDGGICTGQQFLAYEYSYCINDPSTLTLCALTGRFYNRHIRACK
jgi:hypothetical protein